jgi:hypothetical protein
MLTIVGPHGEVQGRTPVMNEHGKSDNSIVPRRSPNNGLRESAEAVEGRELAKGNLLGQTTHRTQSRTSVPSALERVR